MAMLEIRRDLGPYRLQWDAFALTADRPSPFLRSWWTEALAEPGGRFVLVVDGERLLGGIALEQRSRWGVTRFGLLGSDMYPVYCDAVARPDAGDVVASSLSRWLRSHRQCLYDFDGVRPEALLGRIVAGDGERRRVAGAAWASLEGGYDSYVAGRSRNLRSSIRRHGKRLSGQGYAHHELAQHDPDAALATLRSVHTQRFGQASVFLPGFERFASAARAGMRSGEFAVHTLARDDDVLAVEACFQVGDTVASYQAGIDSSRAEARGAGTVLLAAVIEHACARGAKRFSFLRGEEDYKLRWADGVDDVDRLRGEQGRVTHQLLRAHRVRSRLRASLWSEQSGLVDVRVPS